MGPNTELVITHRPGRDGDLVLTAASGGTPLHQDTVDITLAADRERFVSQLCDGHSGLDTQAVRETLLAMAVAHERAQDGRSPPKPLTRRRVQPYSPFPTHVLPPKVARYIREAAAAIGCDEAFVALPLLTGLASAVGTTRRIVLKRTWKEYPILWTAVVAESGSKKSPPFDLALSPLHRLQRESIQQWEQKQREYEEQMLDYERQVVQFRRSKGINEMPPKPEKPFPEHLLVQDTTVEALAPILAGNPRGVLLARDELAGWFGGFDQYKGVKGADAPHWLEMFRGGPLKVDRKAAGTLYVPAAAVWVTGTIQPAVLARSLGRAHFENGMAPRLLLAYPPRRKHGWTEEEVDPDSSAAVEHVYAKLRTLNFSVDYDGERLPLDLPLTSAGKARWVEFVNRHAEEQFALGGGELAAAWSKLECYTARLALLIHLIRQAEGDLPPGAPDAVDEQSVDAAVELTRWFGREAERVYAVLSESDDERRLRELEERVLSLGGRATPRELVQRCRKYRRDPAAAEADLQALVDGSRGRWEAPAPGPRGGHPTRVFVLSTDADNVNETPAPAPVAVGNVDVGAVDAPTPDPPKGVIEI